ncbi:hypothetical protein [Oceanobacillus picturae]|uniref:hypothetical protein n=1 Tax=Oceanobacillus picturae TaxID=171693 RepID=UPI0036411833
MGGLLEFIVVTLVIGVAIFLLSTLFKEKGILIPIVTSLLSIILIVCGFIEGGFGGMGMGYIGISALIASIIDLFILIFIMAKKMAKE